MTYTNELLMWLAENIMKWKWNNTLSAYVPNSDSYTINDIVFKEKWRPDIDRNQLAELLLMIPDDKWLDVEIRVLQEYRGHKGIVKYFLTINPLIVCKMIYEACNRIEAYNRL